MDFNLQLWIHNAFAYLILLSRLMADPETLFLLILVALTFVVIGMSFIVYIMIISEREKRRLEVKEDSTGEKETEQECLHFFGYLAGYPPNEPIPDECFGCIKAIECMNAKAVENTTEAVEPEPAQQQ